MNKIKQYRSCLMIGVLFYHILLLKPVWAEENYWIKACSKNFDEQDFLGLNQPLCTGAILGKNDPELQPLITRCLTKMFGCGYYLQIVNALHTDALKEQAKLPDTQHYFLGASYYRLSLETRALRCIHRKKAKANLLDFLREVKKQYRASGAFANLELSHIRSATNIVRHIKTQKGCRESAVTKAELGLMATDYAMDRTKEMFLSARPSSDASGDEEEVQSKLNELFSALRSFSTVASEIEIGLQNMQTEIETNKRQIGEDIKKRNDTGGDSMSLTALLQSGLGFRRVFFRDKTCYTTPSARGRMFGPGKIALEKAANFRNAADSLEEAKNDAFSEEFGGKRYGPDMYMELKRRYSHLAYLWAAEAAFQYSLRQDTVKNNAYNRLQQTLDQRGNDDPNSIFIDAFKRTFSPDGDDCLIDPTLWYCDNT